MSEAITIVYVAGAYTARTPERHRKNIRNAAEVALAIERERGLR